MHTINGRKYIGTGLMILGWLLAISAAPVTAMADGCTESPNSQFTLLVDSSSSCEALSSNMTGCQTDATGTCTIPNPTPGGTPIVVTVTPSDAVGTSGTFSWSATGPASLGNKQVDVAISIGATGGGTCGWSYTPGESSDMNLGFLKSNGSYQKVNDIFFCSDFTAPPPALAKIVLSKTVMASGGTCGVDDVEVLDVNTGAEVEYCFSVENVGAGNASSIVLSDPGVFATDQSLSNLNAGAPVTVITSPPVFITETGENINTATVSWINSEDPALSTGSASDTSKVIASVGVEACPDEYQDLVDGVIAGSEDFFGFAALYDPLAPERVALCAPSGATGTPCIDECKLKESTDPSDPWSCVDDPTNANCIEPNYPCESSGYWSVGTVSSCDTSGIGEGTPYCWELAADPRDSVTGLPDCYYKPVQVMKSHLLTIEEIHQNPFCFKSTAVNIDGTSTTTLFCF